MAKEKNPQYGNKVQTGECFASFPHLVKPDEGRQYSTGKFSVDAIFCDKESMRSLVEECKRLAQLNFGSTEGIKYPWKNGSEGSISKFQGYPDHFYISPTTGADKAPAVVGPNPRTVQADANGIFDRSKIYAGAVIRVNVTPKAYNMPKKVIKVMPDGKEKEVTIEVKGITLYLNGVQFVRDSERFGGEDSGTGGFDDASPSTSGDVDDMLDF